ncbi:MAG: hypothetical protein HC765_10850 [Brachymonas sp.]|nr:hypothetical protein [Brachymonas sp.]
MIRSSLVRYIATACLMLSAQAQTLPTVDAKNLPIADVHFHYMAFMMPEALRTFVEMFPNTEKSSMEPMPCHGRKSGLPKRRATI